MLNRIACAALFSVLSLLGSGNAAADPTDIDSDDDLIECIVPNQQPSPSGGGLARVAHSDPPDVAWIIRRNGGSAAAAARRLPHDVVVVDLAADGGDEADTLLLLDRAITFARDHGAVKMVVRANGVPAAALWSKMCAHGCQFAAARVLPQGGPTVEFYTDIYRSAAPDRIASRRGRRTA